MWERGAGSVGVGATGAAVREGRVRRRRPPALVHVLPALPALPALRALADAAGRARGCAVSGLPASAGRQRVSVVELEPPRAQRLLHLMEGAVWPPRADVSPPRRPAPPRAAPRRPVPPRARHANANANANENHQTGRARDASGRASAHEAYKAGPQAHQADGLPRAR